MLLFPASFLRNMADAALAKQGVLRHESQTRRIRLNLTFGPISYTQLCQQLHEGACWADANASWASRGSSCGVHSTISRTPCRSYQGLAGIIAAAQGDPQNRLISGPACSSQPVGAEAGEVTQSMDDELQAKHVAGLPADSRHQLIQLFRVRLAQFVDRVGKVGP